MQKDRVQAWEELYAAAVLENDPARMVDRINRAQDALRQRWQMLRQARPGDREKQRVEDAIRTLNLIRQTELRTSA
jgi:hypothetical protein